MPKHSRGREAGLSDLDPVAAGRCE